MDHEQSSADCTQRNLSLSQLDESIDADLVKAALELRKYPDRSPYVICGEEQSCYEEDAWEEKCVANQEKMLQMERTVLSVVSNLLSEPLMNYPSVEIVPRPHAESSTSPSIVWTPHQIGSPYENDMTISTPRNSHGGTMPWCTVGNRHPLPANHQVTSVPVISSSQEGSSCSPSRTSLCTPSQHIAPQGTQMNEMEWLLSPETNRLPLENSPRKLLLEQECFGTSFLKSQLDETYTRNIDKEIKTSNGMPASHPKNSDLSCSIQERNACNISSLIVEEGRSEGSVSASEAGASNRELNSNFEQIIRLQPFLKSSRNIGFPANSRFSKISKDAYQSPSFENETWEYEEQGTKASEEYVSPISLNTVKISSSNFNSSDVPHTNDEIKCSKSRSPTILLQVDRSAPMGAQLSNESYQSGSQSISSTIRDTSLASENKTKSVGAKNRIIDLALNSQRPGTWNENTGEQKVDHLLISVLSEGQVRLSGQNQILLLPEQTIKIPLPPVARSARYKTEECMSFLEHLSCPYGTKCQFAHGTAELRPTHRNSSYKTKACDNFSEKGTCRYGLRCNFLHGRNDPQKPRKARQRIDSENDAQCSMLELKEVDM